jgi:serine/threonine protein kinase
MKRQRVGPYECEVMLGTGTYGMVLRAKDVTTGRLVAVKLSKDPREGDIQEELQIYLRLAGDDDARTCGSFLPVLAHDAEAPIPWFALPLCGCSLAEHLHEHGPLSESWAQAAAAQLAVGLAHLGRLGLAHLDVKPGNLLWRASALELRIVDLGMCLEVPVTSTSTLRYNTYCTEPYRPPELWTPCGPGYLCRLLSPCVDVWSMGCVMYEAVTGKPLMYMINPRSFERAVRWWVEGHAHPRQARGTVMAYLRRAPTGWQHFVWKCCDPDPRARPTLRCLSDGASWVREICEGQTSKLPQR